MHPSSSSSVSVSVVVFGRAAAATASSSSKKKTKRSPTSSSFLAAAFLVLLLLGCENDNYYGTTSCAAFSSIRPLSYAIHHRHRRHHRRGRRQQATKNDDVADDETDGGASSSWLPLPHFPPSPNRAATAASSVGEEPRDVFLRKTTAKTTAAAAAVAAAGGTTAAAALAAPLQAATAAASSTTPNDYWASATKGGTTDNDQRDGRSSSSPASALGRRTTATNKATRSVVSAEKHPSIPVWPTWGGGSVVPVPLGAPLQDPFLLLAHHDHWFDPRDPLRGPFRAVGKALGLPYVDVEGFSMHPHRGFDILTYVLDGSDGFRHRDSLGKTQKTYRGGTAQFMRTGSGVLHEEFWETLPDRRTSIELFQLWINLPASHKFDAPSILYVGNDTDDPWVETPILDPATNAKVAGTVRHIGATLERAVAKLQSDGVVRPRPPVAIRHATIDPGGQWTVDDIPKDHSAVLYVRKGTATLPDNKKSNIDDGEDGVVLRAKQTATFAPDGDCIVIRNDDGGEGGAQSFLGLPLKQKQQPLDVLLLTGQPLREPVAQAGPIVMNTQSELSDAYQQLSDGTFLNRDYVLHCQEQQKQWGWS